MTTTHKSDNKRALITAPFYEDYLDELKEHFDVTYRPNIESSELCRIIDGYNILIIATYPHIDHKVLTNAHSLELIVRLGIGIDQIDLETCREMGIKVCNTPKSNSLPVVELVFSQLIRVLRRLDRARESLMDGRFRTNLQLGDELCGQKIGVVGAGRIGSKVCHLADFFSMPVTAYDPYLTTDEKDGIKADNWSDSLERLIESSKVVSLHVPLTEETTHMVNYDFLSRMQDNSVLINTSRGKVVNFEDVRRVLIEGKQIQFIFDVFENEPFIPNFVEGQYPNLHLTPHIGANTTSSLQKRSRECLVELNDYLLGLEPHGLIDFEKGY